LIIVTNTIFIENHRDITANIVTVQNVQGKNMLLNKTVNELGEQWEIASQMDNYRDSIAQGYPSEKAFRSIGESQTKGILDYLKEYNISITGKTVVEIGCGAGRITEFLAKKCKLVYATDISSGMLYRFEQRLGNIENVKLICSDNLSLIPNESTDLILSLLVFQHNPEQMVEKFFEDGHRILKSNGYYVFQLSTQNRHQVIQKNQATDIVRWTTKELEEVANKYGYKMINKLDDFLKIWQKI
jgi:ubiquinone/menaquinone biosynthesis C-methylase UbiE